MNDGETTEATPTKAVRAELASRMADMMAVIVGNDAARIGTFMGDEWVIIGSSGVSPRAEFLATIESGELSHSAMDQVGEATIQVHGDTALYIARVTNTATYQGQSFDSDEWTTSAFVRRDGSWQCVLVHLTSADTA